MKALIVRLPYITCQALAPNREECCGQEYYVTQGGFHAALKCSAMDFETVDDARDFILGFLFGLPSAYNYRYQIHYGNGEPEGYYQISNRWER